jgi:N-glycosylase/DNA lyase
MTPKIYDDVNTKLLNVWGDYAGWAHSVCVLSRSYPNFFMSAQVLFTADLKSFSTYGLEIPPESSTPIEQTNGDMNKILALPTPPMTPSPSPLKRKRGDQVSEVATVTTAKQNDSSDVLSLAERVKTRRRARKTDRYT